MIKIGISIFFLLIGIQIEIVSSHRVDEVSNGPYPKGKLLLTHIIYRHGNRTPVISYPNDPLFNSYYFPEGAGMLTDVGKEVQYELGRYIHRRYKRFLSPTVSKKELYVRSTNVSRCIESAQFNSAGITAPKSYHFGERFTEQQIIPIHLDPSEDYVLYPENCTRATEIQNQYLNSTQIQELQKENSQVLEFLSENTGIPITSIGVAALIYDTIKIEHDMGLPVANWINVALEKYGDTLDYFYALSIAASTVTTELKKIRSGFLIEDILDRCESRIAGVLDPNLKIYIYSAHDYTVESFLNSLGLFTVMKPVPFAASVFVELYQHDSEFFLRIYYRHNDAEELNALKIRHCGTNCPLNKMYQLYKDILPTKDETFESMCNYEIS